MELQKGQPRAGQNTQVFRHMQRIWRSVQLLALHRLILTLNQNTDAHYCFHCCTHKRQYGESLCLIPELSTVICQILWVSTLLFFQSHYNKQDLQYSWLGIYFGLAMSHRCKRIWTKHWNRWRYTNSLEYFYWCTKLLLTAFLRNRVGDFLAYQFWDDSCPWSPFQLPLGSSYFFP